MLFVRERGIQTGVCGLNVETGSGIGYWSIRRFVEAFYGRF